MTVTDTLGRPLRSLRISVTDRCNLRCAYCMPEEDYVWLPRQDILTFEEVSTLVDVFAGLGVDKLRLTGGEPLLRRDVPALVRLLARKHTIRDLALTTNGVLLAEQARPLRDAGLHRITISLDTLRPERFRELTRVDTHRAVLAGIEAAVAAGFDSVKLDAVVIRGANDDELVELVGVQQAGRCRGALHRVHGCGRRHTVVDGQRRVQTRHLGHARSSLRLDDTDRRGKLSTCRSLQAAGWHHLRHHLVDHGTLLPSV